MVRICVTQTLLDWDPQKRFTPDMALKHEWILEGLPRNVLYHHCRMYDVAPHEVPARLLRDDGGAKAGQRSNHNKGHSLNLTESQKSVKNAIREGRLGAGLGGVGVNEQAMNSLN